jgi:hypothetical protein
MFANSTQTDLSKNLHILAIVFINIRPTQALKGLGNTFDLNPKWARTLPSRILHGIFKEEPP